MTTTFDQKLADIFNKWTIDGWPIGNLVLVFIALLLSMLLCGLIGMEREKKGRSAGLRTHLLVGVGSCVIMIISIYGFPEATSEKRDVSRLAAQIITGVGFLGAGAIMHSRSGIKGLTTAGTIWVVMAIGIACGSFNFILATLATAIVMVILVIVRKFEIKINGKKPYIVLTAPADEAILEKIHLISKEYNCSIVGLTTELIEEEGGNKISCSFHALFGEDDVPKVPEYVAKLQKETNSISIETFTHKQ